MSKSLHWFPGWYDLKDEIYLSKFVDAVSKEVSEEEGYLFNGINYPIRVLSVDSSGNVTRFEDAEGGSYVSGTVLHHHRQYFKRVKCPYQPKKDPVKEEPKELPLDQLIDIMCKFGSIRINGCTSAIANSNELRKHLTKLRNLKLRELNATKKTLTTQLNSVMKKLDALND